MKARTLLLSTVAMHFVLSCTAGATTAGRQPGDASGFEAEWQKYLTLGHHKALAVAGEIEGAYVSGSAHDAPTIEIAVTMALRTCSTRRQEQKTVPICRTYAIGDVKVGVEAE